MLILLLAVGALAFLYHQIESAVIHALVGSSGALTPELIRQIEAARARYIFEISSVLFSTAVIFGYLISRLALLPARNTLAAQKQFIGNVAHELRTPLSIIKANTEIRLLDMNISAPARATHLENLEELDRISDIINNLLSLNTFSNPGNIAFGNVDMRKVAHRAVSRLSPLARKKPLKIFIKTSRKHVAWGNAAALEQIVMNLLKNAIQNTDQGEIVIFIGPDEEGYLRLVMRDSGAGISRQDLKRVFEPFFRSDRSRTRNGTSSNGLGLAIVSELVRLHRGRIMIRSALGEGTTVTVTLPLGRNEVERENKDQDPHMVSVDFTHE